MSLDTTPRDTKISGGSPERFGYSWAANSELRPEYEEQFRRWTAPLQPTDWRGLSFIDVGCGMGRNSYWPMTYGAAGGLAIDVDDRSLAAARATLAPFPSVRVEKRSAYEIGCADEFDIAYSIGVIHHLQEPERALRNGRGDKAGRRVMIWVWPREQFSPFSIAAQKAPLAARQSSASSCDLSSVLLWLAPSRLRPGRVFRLRWLLSPARLSSTRCCRIARTGRVDRERMMREQELLDIHLHWVNEMSWSAIGTKPARPAE